jgi:hypothetical protein
MTKKWNCIDSASEEQFKKLSSNVQKQFFMTAKDFTCIMSLLEMGKWRYRKFYEIIHLIIEKLDLSEENKPILNLLNEGEHNDQVDMKDTLQKCILLLEKWCPIFIEYGKQEDNKFILKNGRIHPNFENFLNGINDIVSFSINTNPDLYILGLKSANDFFEILKKYDENILEIPSFIKYTQGKMVDQSGSFEFGDVYSSTFTGSNRVLPVEIRD